MRTAIYDLIDWLNESFSMTDFSQAVFPLKVILAIISILLLIAIIILILKIRKNMADYLGTMVKSVVPSDEPQKISLEGWQSVLDKLNRNSEDSYKQAVIEADKIFDDLLRKSGYQGEDMGERLKQITQDQLVNIDEIWQAHKLRNRLVHEPDFELREHEARRMIEIYQKALENLEAI